MKKTVVMILLVLPFLLIYFISFTGQILSKYTHINVERVVILDSSGNELKDDDYIKIGLDEEYRIRVKVYPELASNKEVIISNSDKAVVDVNADTLVVTPLKYGESTIIITSVDRHFVQCIFKIVVAQDEIEDIIVQTPEVTVPKGKKKQAVVSIYPDTVVAQYRDLQWISSNGDIAKVSNNGEITGVAVGTTIITVRSVLKPEISKTIIVHVVADFGDGVWFDNDNAGKLYSVTSATFDLKGITIINLDGVTIDNVMYKLTNNPSADKLDYTNISGNGVVADGVLNFKATKTIVSVSVSVSVGGKSYSDIISLIYLGE